MPSFNRGQYIREALDSVFCQQTNYQFKIIIADDASTDNTLEIIKEYKDKYPDKIEIWTSEKNQGLHQNILRVYRNIKTDYWTVLDPDDYWTDNLLIQKALVFFENNKEWTIYAANINVIDQTTNDKRQTTNMPYVRLKPKYKIIDSSFQDYLNGKAVLSCTQASFYRNIFNDELFNKMAQIDLEIAKQAFRGDSFRNAVHLYKGNAHFVNEICAVYRITGTGLWTAISEFAKNNLNTLIFMVLFKFFDEKYPQLKRFAYKTFNINKNIILSIIKGNYEKGILSEAQIDAFFYLLKQFIQNPVSTDDKSISLKNKIRLKIYGYLKSKVSEKGLD
jgi:glycosyltransferase involved in cell wall biosynthesis